MNFKVVDNLLAKKSIVSSIATQIHFLIQLTGHSPQYVSAPTYEKPICQTNSLCQDFVSVNRFL